MNVTIRKYEERDIGPMVEIWNAVVVEGIAFPQTEILSKEAGFEFFKDQTYCGIAENPESGEILGLYILHPNNIGRCGHIANASYAVAPHSRGMHIGEQLVIDCLQKGKKADFIILQLNAVVKTNYGARRLYEKLDFTPLGTIPRGFLMKNGNYEDIVLYYHEL